MKDANDRVNRALCGSAISMGCELEIEDNMGASPLTDNEELAKIADKAIKLLSPDAKFYFFDRVDAGSTDMGDLSCLMPALHLYIPGASGIGHGKNYEISDPDTACLTSAKWQLVMLKILLENDAEKARNVIEDYEPTFRTKEEYINIQKLMFCSGDKVHYEAENEVRVEL